MNADEESYFQLAKKVTNSEHTELESFVDLVGGMSSGEFDQFDYGEGRR
jgi:halogenation protein CepH